MPLIQLHSFTHLSPPLISQPCRFQSAVKSDSFPPGEAKGQLRELIPFNVLLCSIRKWAVQNHRYTPSNAAHSLSFAFAQQLPQRGSRGRFAPGACPYASKLRSNAISAR